MARPPVDHAVVPIVQAVPAGGTEGITPLLSPSGRWLAFPSIGGDVTIVDTCTASVRSHVRITIHTKLEAHKGAVMQSLRENPGQPVPGSDKVVPFFNERDLLQYGELQWEPWSGRPVDASAAPASMPQSCPAQARRSLTTASTDARCAVASPDGDWTVLGTAEPLRATDGTQVSWGIFGPTALPVAGAGSPPRVLQLRVCDREGLTVSSGTLPVGGGGTVLDTFGGTATVDAAGQRLFEMGSLSSNIQIWSLQRAQLEDIVPSPLHAMAGAAQSAIVKIGASPQLRLVSGHLQICASQPVLRHSEQLRARCYLSWDFQKRQWSLISRTPALSPEEMAALGISTDADADASASWIAVPDGAGKARVLDRRTGRAWLAKPDLLYEYYSTTTLAPNGSTLVAGPGLSGGRLAVWDLATGEARGRLPSESIAFPGAMMIHHYAITADSRRLYAVTRPSQGPAELIEWDLHTMAPVRRLMALASDSISDLRVGISPDGRYLVASDTGGLHVFHGDGYRQHRWHPTALGDVPTRLDFQPGGNLLIAMGAVTSLHRLDAPGPSTVIVHHGQRSAEAFALFYTPDGRFTGDEELFDDIWLRMGSSPDDDLLTADAAFESFHDPSLMRRFMAGEVLPPTAGSAGRAPSVEVTSIAERGPKAETQRFELMVTDRGGGVGEVRVYVNGARQLDPSAAFGANTEASTQGSSSGTRTRGLRIVAETSPAAEVAASTGAPSGLRGAGTHVVEVPLAAGDNTITVEAYSERGAIRGKRASFATARPSAKTLPALHLLVVSVGQYADPALNLQLTDADAKAVIDALGSGAKGVFRAVHPTWVKGEDATRDGVLRALTKIAATGQPEDVFVLYVASHGVLHRCGDGSADYQLLLRGTTEASPCEDQIAMSEISSLIGSLPAQRKLVMLDTCQSGAAISESAMQTLDGLRTGQLRMASRHGVAVIAASASSQVAFESSELGHGLFTVALLRGLSGRASLEADGPIGVRNLVHYVARQLPFLAARHASGATQTPSFGASGTDFLLGRSTSASPAGEIDDAIGRSGISAEQGKRR